MKKTHMRIFSLLLSIVMVLGLLAGCGGNNSTPNNTDSPASPDSQGSAVDPADDPLLNNEETINLTVFSQLANWSGAQTGWSAALLKDKFNIELTIIPDTNGAYQTRMESGTTTTWASTPSGWTTPSRIWACTISTTTATARVPRWPSATCIPRCSAGLFTMR